MMPAKRDTPRPGQESVWDYPRPPKVEPFENHRIAIEFAARTLADTTRAIKLMETSHPPGYYIPAEDIDMHALVPSTYRTVCEFKGTAHFYSIVMGNRVEHNAAWEYPDPLPGYEMLRGHIAFYPQQIDAASIDGEVVRPQEGRFYGGWITDDIVGPFKGGRGTLGW